MISSAQIKPFKLAVRFLLVLLLTVNISIVSVIAEPLKSAAEPDYPPFSMQGDDGKAIGFSVELLNATAKVMKREIDIKVDAWSTIKQELADNKLDVLPLVGRTPEREKIFDFTIPYLTLHGTIVVRKGNDTIQTSKDLMTVKVGVMKGDVAEEFMLREKLTYNLVTNENYDIALQLLNTGKLDAVVVQNLVALQLIKKHALNNLETRGKLKNFRQEWSFAVTEGDKALLAELNEGLSILIADGTYDQLRHKWLGILEPDHTKKHVYITLITAIIVLLVSLLIARLWQSSLHSKVKKGIAELNHYKDSLEELVISRTKELEAEKFNLNQAQEITHIGNYRWNVEDDKTSWSDELFRIVGYASQSFEPSYEKYLSCIHHEDREIFSSLTEQAMNNKCGYSGEYRIVRPDAEIRFIAEKGEVKLNQENNITALNGVIQDITERKVAENKLQKAYDELEFRVQERTKELTEEVKEREKAEKKAEAANMAKSAFLANISHELRTPMHAILSFSELGEEKIDVASNEKIKSYLSMIRQSGQRLMVLLNDLLDLSKLEAGQMEFYKEQHEFGKVVELAVTELNVLANKKMIKLIIDPETAKVEGCFDSDKLLQVIRNLISNAIKFTAEEKSITLSYQKTVSDISFVISDQGTGIPEDELNSVFNKFVQSSKIKTGTGGTGLGLAICKEIIEGHGGTISAANNPNGGAIFTFVIPR